MIHGNGIVITNNSICIYDIIMNMTFGISSIITTGSATSHVKYSTSLLSFAGVDQDNLKTYS